jgi:hypothetical protein
VIAPIEESTNLVQIEQGANIVQIEEGANFVQIEERAKTIPIDDDINNIQPFNPMEVVHPMEVVQNPVFVDNNSGGLPYPLYVNASSSSDEYELTPKKSK